MIHVYSDLYKDKDAEKKEVERDHLYQKVGQLQIEVDWLKKRPAIWDECLGESQMHRGQKYENRKYENYIDARTFNGTCPMNLNTHPTTEINQKATQILFQQMGVVDTFRFFNQFTLGSGDYTKERHQWLDDLSLQDIVAEIKTRRN